MSGQQTSNTTQQQTNVANPAMQAAVSPILNMVPGIATTAYNPAMNVNVAGLNAQQQAAISGLGGLQSNNPAEQYLNQANQYSRQAADPNSVLRMQQQFYNPMASAVEAQLGNIFGQQNAQLVGNAAASGAIGGSRYGVAAGNLANQQGLAAGQTLSGLQQQALNAAQTEQGQISQQAFTQGQLGQEALNTQLQGISAALQGGNITQQQAQALYNAATQNAIQATLFPQQEAAAAANIAGIGTTLGGTTYGQGQTTQPVNYLGQVIGAGITGYGLYSSDERVKENIEPIGKSFDKQTIYKFNYIGDPSPRIGLMAQEVQKKHPDAVKEIAGTKAVDYNKATAKSAEIGERRLHRAIGGGTGIGNGVSGIEGFGGLQSGLAPYFAQSPQVNVPAVHFPTINLNPQQQGPSQAQQQADQNAQQMMALGKDLSHGHLGSDINTGLGNAVFGSSPTTSDGGWNTSVQPSGGFLGGLQDYIGAAHGGRIHRDDGGSIQAANDAFLANNQGFGLGLIPPANAAVAPADLTPSATNQLDKSAPLAPIGSTAQTAALTPAATVMDGQSRIPGPHQYIPMGYDGLPTGHAQPAASDPALVMASIGSPAQTTAPAPISAQETPSVSSGAVQLIKGFEGYRPHAYGDETRLSIGYGTAALSPHEIVSPQVAEERLKRHVATQVDPWINQNVTAPLSQNQRDALTSYIYHAGTGRAQNLLPAINSGDYEAASQAMLGSVHSRNPDVDNGLQQRLSKEASMFAGRSLGSSVLDRPDLQPPKPGESELDKRMAEFGFQRNQPQGLGGSLGRALGIQGGLDPQTSNRLVNMGLGMMASGPTVGVKGFPGAAISALTSAGKGGQFALNQEQQERAQAINLANAATRQQLEQAQMQRALKPEWQTIRKELVPTIDPVTKMTYWKEREVKGWVNPFTQEITEGPQPPVAPIQTPGSTPSSANATSASPSALPGGVTFTQADGSEAPVPTAIAEKFNPEDPIDQLSLRILSGQASMPTSQRQDPRYIALKKRVYELDPTYNQNRSDFYKQYAGPNGKTQLSYDAFGTAMKHAHTLDDANWNKNLTDTGFGPLTEIPQAIQRARGNPKLKDYENTATAYADEHYRALVPSGAGTQKERERAESTVSAATPRQGRLAGNAANVDILLGKMLKLDDKYNKNMGVAASINKPQLLTPDDREIIRNIFAHEPDTDLKRQRYERYSKDPRTADLVSPPTKAPTKETPAAAQPQAQQAAPTLSTQRPPGMSDDEIRAKAKASGKDPAAVAAQLKAWGINP